MKRTLNLLLVSLLFAAAAGSARAAEKPKLVLAVVVDQFRYDYLTRFRDDYHAGFARLLDHGVVYADAHFIQFPTVTAVGHSTFLSGATPSVSGIIGNEWYDRTTNSVVTSVSDDATTLVGAAAGAQGSSPHRLLVSTLGDELKIAGKASKVIGISIKDRAAILPSGHMADAAYWFDNHSNHIVTSTYYMKELPAWVRTFNENLPAAKYSTAVWMPLHAKRGDKPFCSLAADRGDLRSCGSIEATPFGNELIERFTEQAIQSENLGGHDNTDLLTVSFSANDYAGHVYGPDAPEIRDISLRTDEVLGKLLDYIDARIGPGKTLVVLTADHGVAPVPEVNTARKMPGGRLDAKDLSQTLSGLLAQRFGPGDWFVFDSGGFLYLNYGTIGSNKTDLASVERLSAGVARAFSHIARVFTRDDLLRGEGTADPVSRAALLGFNASRSGDLFLLPEPYYIFAASGTSHSTPYGYDTHVPLIFYRDGMRPSIQYESVTPNDIAPTLAAMLEVEPPSGSSGRILTELLK